MKKLLLFLFIATQAIYVAAQSISSGQAPIARELNPISGSLNYVEYYVALSAGELNWDTPIDLYKTFKISRSRNGTSMGHGGIHFNCTTSNGKRYRGWNGYTGSRSSRKGLASVLLRKEGLGILFENMKGGHLAGNESTKRFYHENRGRIEIVDGIKIRATPTFIRVFVTENMCDELVNYLNFVDQQIGVFRSGGYGLTARPYDFYMKHRNRESVPKDFAAGCTSYSTGGFKAMGLWDEILEKAWMKRVKISSSWIGNEIDLESGEKRRVKLFKRLKSDEGEHFVFDDSSVVKEMSFYDPESIWDFIDGALKCLEPNNPGFVESCLYEQQEWLNKFRDTKVVKKKFSNGLSHFGLELHL